MIKKIIKNIIGLKRKAYFSGVLKILKNKSAYKKQHLIYEKELVEDVKVFSSKGYDVFCGYYDYYPLSSSNNKLLCHRVKKGASTSKNDIEIGFFNLNDTKKFNKICTSKAWCWQQGSRLHWSFKNSDLIYYNDVENNEYCTKIININTNKVVKKIVPALYDISHDEMYGASLNFSRLQRLRPGYGYNRLPDETIDEKAPTDDGLFLVNLSNNKKKLLLSLKQLAADVDEKNKYSHYINHVSFSPNSKQVMFFHLWSYNSWPGWNNRLCIYNIKTHKLSILEDKYLISHYDWIDDDNLLITCADKDTKKMFYQIYNVISMKKNKLSEKYLNEDGHPTFVNYISGFVSDTYPNRDFRQTVFMYDIIKNKKYKLVDLFSDPRLSEEYRCDLHPKLHGVNLPIIVDTTCFNCSRSIIMFSMKDQIVRSEKK